MKKEQILQILPQRPPMLMVDDILEVVPGQYAVGYKKVNNEETWVQGHFPGEPIFPGVLLIEHMAQTALFICTKQQGEQKPYLAKVEELKFLLPVMPGAELYTKVEKISSAAGFLKIRAVSSLDYLGKNKVAKGILVCYLGKDME